MKCRFGVRGSFGAGGSFAPAVLVQGLLTFYIHYECKCLLAYCQRPVLSWFQETANKEPGVKPVLTTGRRGSILNPSDSSIFFVTQPSRRTAASRSVAFFFMPSLQSEVVIPRALKGDSCRSSPSPRTLIGTIFGRTLGHHRYTPDGHKPGP